MNGQPSLVPAEDIVAEDTVPRDTVLTDRFIFWLLMCALVPIPVFALFAGPDATKLPSVQTTVYVLMLLNIMHVGLTSLFWIDSRYRAHMASHPRQYYGNAAGVMAAFMFAILYIGPWFLSVITAFVLSWNLYHFGRQNWGVLCLTATGTKGPRPGKLENLACHIACFGGIIGSLPNSIPSLSFYGFQAAGCSLVLCGLALSCVVACKLIHDRANPLRIVMTVAIGLYFLPLFLVPSLGFTTIATIHTGQYVVIMMVLAADVRQGSRILRIGGMIALAALYLGWYQIMNGDFSGAIWGAWSQPAAALALSVLTWHFMIDAGVFRLGQRMQRKAMAESFPFLFAARVITVPGQGSTDAPK